MISAADVVIADDPQFGTLAEHEVQVVDRCLAEHQRHGHRRGERQPAAQVGQEAVGGDIGIRFGHLVHRVAGQHPAQPTEQRGGARRQHAGRHGTLCPRDGADAPAVAVVGNHGAGHDAEHEAVQHEDQHRRGEQRQVWTPSRLLRSNSSAIAVIRKPRGLRRAGIPMTPRSACSTGRSCSSGRDSPVPGRWGGAGARASSCGPRRRAPPSRRRRCAPRPRRPNRRPARGSGRSWRRRRARRRTRRSGRR